MNDLELQQLVEQVSLTWFKKPFRHQAKFNRRLRTTGGRYLPQSHAIEMNPKYLTTCGLAYFTDIIKHELCHYHLHLARRGFKHRDQDFRQLLKEVDAPRFCKPLETEEKMHIYACKKCHRSFARKRRFRVERYRCGNCGGELVYLEEKIISLKNK